jgi:hypothetical protein
MRRNPAVAVAIGILLLLAACGGAAGPSTSSSPPTEQASDTPAPAATPALDPSVAPTPTAGDTTGLTCSSGDMPNLDSGWKLLKGRDGTFGVAYPEDWEDLSGSDFAAATLLDEQTFAELGLATDATIEADFVRSPELVPNLSVFRFGTVRSTSTEIREREVARYGGLAEIQRMVDPSVEGCLGGNRAPGLALEFRSSDDDNTYHQQNLFAVRNGDLYVVQWLDRLDPNTDLLADIMTTWGWIGL